MIRAFGADHAVLLSTHILAEATLICRRVAIINHGRLLAIDSPTGLQRADGADQPGRRCEVTGAGAPPCATALLSVDGRPRGRHARGRGRRAACSPSTARWTPRDGVEAAIARAVAGRWDLHRLERQPAHAREHLPALRPGAAGERGGGVSGTLAVYQKELATYFRSPIAYYVVAVFLLGSGYFFLYNIFLSGETAMAGTFQNMGILLIDPGPGDLDAAVRRRVQRGHRGAAADAAALARGRSSLGKFLGAVTILLLITAGHPGRPVPLYLFGTPGDHDDPGRLPRVRAARPGVPRRRPALLDRDPQPDRGRPAHRRGAAGLLVRRPPADLPGLAGACARLVGYLSFSLHFTDFIQGLVRTEAVVFYLIVSAIALTLSAGYLQWRR